MNSTSEEDYANLVEGFYGKTRNFPQRDIEKYWWYHTIDLGDGLITPGCYDYRPSLPLFGFPEDMRGMKVLDVGSATGFFAFEFERRGATVTSVEIPSILEWDCFPGETSRDHLAKVQRELGKLGWTPLKESVDDLFTKSTPDQLYRYLLDGPFEFCHDRLGSKVARRYSRIYDLSEATVGNKDFDLVFAGDVLVHTIDPLGALAAVARLCAGVLIIAQDMPDLSNPQPAMLYIGGDKAGQDCAAWWLPNQQCFEQWLRKLGFSSVNAAGSHSGVMRPGTVTYKRTILHAVKSPGISPPSKSKTV